MLQHKIAIVTGSRAEYGILHQLIRLINNSELMELQLYVTGMHLSPEFGFTVDNIRDEFKTSIFEVEVLLSSDTTRSVGKSISLGILGFIEQFSNNKPEYVILLGDRFEIFAAGIAAIHSNIKVAHIHGGDVGKAIFDNLYRNTLTLLSKIHFAATLKSLIRILNLGVNPDTVYLVGSPTQDQIINTDLFAREELAGELGINVSNKWLTVLYHPSENLETSETEFSELITTLKELALTLDFHCIIIYPNADSGGRRIISLINQLADDKKFTIFKNLKRKYYLSLLKNSYLLIGNSSSGLIEGPALDLPVINLGRRQQDREHGDNIINLSSFSVGELKAIIKKMINDQTYYQSFKNGYNPYGDGKSSQRIFTILQDKLSGNIALDTDKIYDNEEIIQKLRKIDRIDISKIKSMAINYQVLLNHIQEEDY